ncbi:3-isopropylmalate dehydrogenase [candidate division KSB1 bacterium]|nr:3-isopropylmalate dehydrogenase [candidate division KSB1 bacterium]
MHESSIKIAVLPGDGIGPEVLAQAVNLLQLYGEKKSLDIQFGFYNVGGAALEKFGVPLPADTLAGCRQADAVLLGAIGHPRWDTMPSDKRPERGLLGLREELGLYANLRPAKIYTGLVDASSLKAEFISKVDILIVRELTGGLYFGHPRGINESQTKAYNTMLYTRFEVERIARMAFEAARGRRKKVTSVDKANVLEVSQFWRKVVMEVAAEYPDVMLEHMYVDNCAMQLVRNPHQFDVILTENMFGDILSDEAAMLTGSLGMLPSASLGNGTALYEPVHGSAPDIAGQNIANPIAAIASVAMLMRFSFSDDAEAECLEEAIAKVLEEGYRTKDIASEKSNMIGTKEMGDKIADLYAAG